MSDRRQCTEAIWQCNPALVQGLGLCPLLGISVNTVNALALGFITLIVLLGSNGLIALLRTQMLPSIRLPIFMIIIATLLSCCQLLTQAFAYELYISIAAFIPLVITNCLVLSRAECCASKSAVFKSTYDAFCMGVGFLLSITLIGMLREILGRGTVFEHMDKLFGSYASDWVIQLSHNAQGCLLFILPPGAFILTGLLIALHQQISATVFKKTVSA